MSWGFHLSCLSFLGRLWFVLLCLIRFICPHLPLFLLQIRLPCCRTCFWLQLFWQVSYASFYKFIQFLRSIHFKYLLSIRRHQWFQSRLLDCSWQLQDHHHWVTLQPFYAFNLHFQIILDYYLLLCMMNVSFAVQYLLLALPLAFLILFVLVQAGFQSLIFWASLTSIELAFQPFIQHNRTLVNRLLGCSSACVH